MNRLLWYISFVLLCLFHTISFPQKVDRINFIPHWIPQAQFAGYYAAYEMGIYKKYNIDINILTGGPDNPASEMIKSGKAEFASLWLTNAIQLREQGIPIINIAQMIRKSALMLVAKKSSGIKTPKDMNNKKVGLWGGDFQIQPMEFFKKYNVKGIPVPQGSSINLFLFDGVQVTSAMWYNEYHRIINSGLNPDELATFFFSDHGLNFPEEGIYVLEDTYLNNPDLCERFIKATIEGWLWSFQNSDEAINIVIKYLKAASLPVNISHQRWMLARFKDLMLDSSSGTINTELSQEGYELVANSLRNSGIIKIIPEFKIFYRPNKNQVTK